MSCWPAIILLHAYWRQLVTVMYTSMAMWGHYTSYRLMSYMVRSAQCSNSPGLWCAYEIGVFNDQRRLSVVSQGWGQCWKQSVAVVSIVWTQCTKCWRKLAIQWVILQFCENSAVGSAVGKGDAVSIADTAGNPSSVALRDMKVIAVAIHVYGSSRLSYLK